MDELVDWWRNPNLNLGYRQPAHGVPGEGNQQANMFGGDPMSIRNPNGVNGNVFPALQKTMDLVIHF